MLKTASSGPVGRLYPGTQYGNQSALSVSLGKTTVRWKCPREEFDSPEPTVDMSETRDTYSPWRL